MKCSEGRKVAYKNGEPETGSDRHCQGSEVKYWPIITPPGQIPCTDSINLGFFYLTDIKI